DLLREARARNVAGVSAQLDIRQVARLDPRWIVTTSDSGTTLSKLRKSPSTKKLLAVKDGRFIVIDASLLAPGPTIGQGLLELAPGRGVRGPVHRLARVRAGPGRRRSDRAAARTWPPPRGRGQLGLRPARTPRGARSARPLRHGRHLGAGRRGQARSGDLRARATGAGRRAGTGTPCGRRRLRRAGSARGRARVRARAARGRRLVVNGR